MSPAEWLDLVGRGREGLPTDSAFAGRDAVAAELDSYPDEPEWDGEDGEQDAWELSGRR